MPNCQLLLEINNENNDYIERILPNSYHPKNIEQISFFDRSITEIDVQTKKYLGVNEFIWNNKISLFHKLHIHNVIPNPFGYTFDKDKWLNFILTYSKLILRCDNRELPILFQSTLYQIDKTFEAFLKLYSLTFMIDKDIEKQEMLRGNYDRLLTIDDYKASLKHDDYEYTINLLKSKKRYLSLYRNLNAFMEGYEDLLETVPNHIKNHNLSLSLSNPEYSYPYNDN